jgi:hypothetical protein
VSYDWKALAPTRPLSIEEIEGGNLYVPRAGEGAAEIEALLGAGMEQPIALFGPAGAGKSTELAALAKRLEPSCVVSLVRLDKELPHSDATSVDVVLKAIAIVAIRLAIADLGLNLSNYWQTVPGVDQAEDAIEAGAKKYLPGGDASAVIAARSIPDGFDLLLAAVREIRGASKQGVVALLVDGLEKASPGLARRTLANLERLSDEARVVVVVPMELTTGPAAAALHGYDLMPVGPVVVNKSVDASWEPGFKFLFEIAARRLGVPPDAIGKTLGNTTVVAMRRCIFWSGGLVRTFLQLLQKAALYAAMRWLAAPDLEDIEHAVSDQTSFLLRLLKEGDTDALRAAHGTSGVEVEIERRVRFLAHGLLLEYRTSAGPIVHIAPLLAGAILKPSPHG